jgi:hypothetical protein
MFVLNQKEFAVTDDTLGALHISIALGITYLFSISVFVIPYGGISAVPLPEAFAGGAPLLLASTALAGVVYLVRRWAKSTHSKATFIASLFILPLVMMVAGAEELFGSEPPSERAEWQFNQCVLKHIYTAKTNAAVSAIRYSCRKLYPALNSTTSIKPVSDRKFIDPFASVQFPMNITEFRKQYPQYDDLSDADLTRALHGKYYSQMDFD